MQNAFRPGTRRVLAPLAPSPCDRRAKADADSALLVQPRSAASGMRYTTRTSLEIAAPERSESCAAKCSRNAALSSAAF